VYVVKGLESLDGATEDEDDYLDKAWSLQPNSRLSCQALLNDNDITVEIPKYTINHASERH
jgi:2Fe-2S ferredoxin